MAALSPVEFMKRYRTLRVHVGAEESASQAMCIPVIHGVQLKTYFMMSWKENTDQLEDYNFITSGGGGKSNAEWFKAHKEQIKNAAMGKGAPHDYELALEWAIRSKKIKTPTQESIQKFCDDRLGIDCSGLVTNYLAASGKREHSNKLVRGNNAQSFYNQLLAINDPFDIKQGDLLVWMTGNRPKSSPGHIAIVESYQARSTPDGNMHVVEATGNANANPKLLDSWYAVEAIFDKGDAKLKNPVMILQVKRHRTSGERVCVIRPM